MTAYSAIDTAVESIRRGAYHYLTKPFKQDELAIFLQRALDEVRLRREASALKNALRAKFSTSRIIGHSAAIQAVRARVQRIADAPAPVIVRGETGTGKGLVARALHGDSRRAERPFVSLNCAALPESLPLDFAVPLVFLVLLIPPITTSAAAVAATAGGLAAMLADELLHPFGLCAAGQVHVPRRMAGSNSGFLVRRRCEPQKSVGLALERRDRNGPQPCATPQLLAAFGDIDVRGTGDWR